MGSIEEYKKVKLIHKKKWHIQNGKSPNPEEIKEEHTIKLWLQV